MTTIITPEVLQGRSLAELQALYHQLQQELVRSERGSAERRNALAGIEALSLAIAQKRIAGPLL